MIRTLARSAVTLVATVSLVATSVAAYAADDLVSDGDGTVPVSSNALSFGTVCVGAPGSRTVAFALRHQGGGQVFANSATVGLSVVSPPSGVSAGSFGSIALPSTWTSLANGTLSNATTGVVTIDTSAVRSYSTTVTFRATGSKDGGGTLSRDDAISLTGSVVRCDSTPPVLTLPGPLTAQATGPSGAPVTYTATAYDAVDGARPVTCSKASGATFALGATTVSCSAADTSGNTANGSFTVTVSDTAGPVLSLPASQTIEATSPTGAAATFTATATDVVDGTRPVTCTPASGTTFALGGTTVACTSTDTRGNASNGSFTVTVRDTTAPSLSLPPGVAAEATSAAGAPVTFTTSATDVADEAVPVVCDHDPGDVFPLGATLVSCSATDDSGNAGTGTFTVTVGDSTGPSVNVPSAPVVAEATGPSGATVAYTASAFDTVDGDLVPSCTPASGTTFALGTTPVGCGATDTAGNTGAAAFDVVVRDTTPPALSLPGDLDAEASSAAGAAVPFAVSAEDLVAGTVEVTCDAPATFPLGVTEVSCSAPDGNGNTAFGSFEVTVVDSTDPVLTLPGDLTAEATSAAGAGVTFEATASDTVSGSVPVTCVPASGSVFPLATTEVACTATDAAGNAAAGTFDVTVADTTAPALHVPAGLVEEATGQGGAAVTYLATADDAVDATVSVVCVPASGATFPLGSTEVDCTATDDAGNADTGSFTVVVQDTTAPLVGVPADQVVEATGPDGAVHDFAATATDAVSDVTADCTPASGATFALGTTTVTCTATDGAGNTGQDSFDVTVVDTTAPSLTLPSVPAVEATGPSGARVTYAATATDAVSGSVPVDCAPASGTVFALGDTDVDCTVTDEAGNAADGSFTVTVVDTTAPALSLPDNVVEEATGPAGNAVAYSATATDAVSGPVPVDCAPASGSTFPVTTTAVTCTAVDGAGNEAAGGFTVTVKDETAPAVTVPDNTVVEATGPAGATHTYSASATDVVDGSVPVDCEPASGATFALGVTGVLCEATDAHGNTGSGGFTVTVVDTVAPVVTVPADRTVEATGPGGAATSFSASATDAVSGTPAVTCDPAGGTTFPLGTTTVTCSATDGAGNTGYASFRVTVVDTTAPAVTVPAARSAEATSAAGAAVPFTTSATDAVSGSLPVTCNPVSGTTFGLGTTPVTCTATDAAGNIGSAGFGVTVSDTTRPSLTLPASFAVVASTPSGATVTYATSAIDAVSGSVPVVCSPASGAAFAVGDTVVGCSATDDAGNTSTGSFTVAVRYAFSGFQQPVNDTGAQSRFRLGSTVPLKFRLGTLGATSVQQAGSPAFAKSYRGAACDTATATEAPPEATSTTGTVYRWDPTGQQYIYNFSTKGLASGEWRVWATTSDGAANYVDICLTK